MTPEFALSRKSAKPLHLIEADDCQTALEAFSPAHRAWAKANGFSGELGQTVLLPDAEGEVEAALFGWG